MTVPNVNFFIGYEDCLEGLSSSDEYMKEHFNSRKFYSANKDYNYLSYVKSGSEEKIDYVSYSGNHEKSLGLFNENGIMNNEDIKQLKEKLQKTNSVIWHGVISFQEEFGNRYCDNFEKAYQMMKEEMPKFFKNAKLVANNISWYAGLHENTDNKHIHFSFFEKCPLRPRERYSKLFYSDGIIPIEAISKTKLSIELKLLDITQSIKEERKEIIETNKSILARGITMKKIKTLILIIPTSGRMSYDSENMQPYKAKIDEITNSIICNNQELFKKYNAFQTLLRDRDNEIINICQKMKVDYTNKLLYAKCMKDIYRRLGNQVLFVAKELRTELRKYETKTKNRLVIKRIEKEKRKALIRQCDYLNNLVNQETINCFKEYLHRLDEANYKRLVEEGYIE